MFEIGHRVFISDPKNSLYGTMGTVDATWNIRGRECVKVRLDIGKEYTFDSKQLERVVPDHAEKAEAVDHPKHYNREGGMECIDEMVIVFGTQAVMDFCLCNVWKYRYRASSKNGAEDLKKAEWYMNKYAELKKGNV